MERHTLVVDISGKIKGWRKKTEEEDNYRPSKWLCPYRKQSPTDRSISFFVFVFIVTFVFIVVSVWTKTRKISYLGSTICYGLLRSRIICWVLQLTLTITLVKIQIPILYQKTHRQSIYLHEHLVFELIHLLVSLSLFQKRSFMIKSKVKTISR